MRLALACLIALAAAACGGGRAAVSAAPPCRTPAAGHGPRLIAGTLSDTDTGGTFCLDRGRTLAVYLHVAPEAQDTRWSPITSSATATLSAVPNGFLTAPLGVTAGFFTGRRDGVATLRSARPDGTAWQVTVVVRS